MIAWFLGMALAQPVPFDEVAETLAAQTGGAIVPVQGADAPEGFEAVHSSPPAWEAHPARAPWDDQGVFAFDVEAWLAHTGDPDFMASKRRFYGELDFLTYEQVHERPWPYLAAWQELFHPPIQSLDLPLEVYTGDLFGPERPNVDDAAWFEPAFQERLDASTQTELTQGNDLTLLDSDHAFREKLRMVKAAKESLYVSVMFFGCDETSDELAEAMKERAAAGVDVRLLTEGVYRRSLGERCADRMIMGGVKVASAGAALSRSAPEAVLHYKVWIRDGEELIEGGTNILDYENKGTGYNFLDRDTDLHITGPMVADAEEGFLLAWDRWSKDTEGDEARLEAIAAKKEQQRRDGVRGAANYGTWLSDPEQRMDGVCRLAMQSLMIERHAIAPIIEAHLEATRHQVVMVSPAMFDYEHDPDDQIGRLMHLVQGRTAADDPRVVILSNGRGGASGELGIWLIRHGWNNRLAGRTVWSDTLFQFMEMTRRRASLRNRAGAMSVLDKNPNVEIWNYFQHLHTKTWLFDRQVTVVGSWNLDLNSADKNYENAAVCMDADLRDAIERDFTDAIVNSIPVTSANGQ
ncbi:MAG: phosphatidylserine/phosphatidylglycerophosphate/cardiolipin synthase family protein [Deltaproteobacteria bacterium]|nr:MAG: phosphatidylserine/phosphatidylglycerophosphate/cardiolipin synthase family protein [Deltaproteobacteria bacterium]